MAHVAVIGGGIGGLVAARAAAEGQRVTLLEASGRLGGRCRTLAADGMALEAGPEDFCGRPGRLRELCGELGLELQQTPPASRRVLALGKTWDLPGGLELRSGAGLHLLGKMEFSRAARWKLGMERFSGGSPQADEPLEAFMERHLGPEAWAVLRPLAAAEWGATPDALGAALAYPELAALEGRGGLIQGSRANPPLEHLSPVGGMGRLAERLADLPGVEVRLGSEAAAVQRTPAGWRVHCRGAVVDADAVVVTLPAPQAAQFFRPTAPQLTTALNQFPAEHHARVYLAFRAADLPQLPWPEPLAELLPGTDAGYNSHSVAARGAPEGYRLLRFELSGEKARMADAELTRMAVADLERIAPGKPRVLASWAFRNPRSRPLLTVGHKRRVGALEAELLQAPGLFLTGGYLAGPDLADLAAHAHTAAGRALDYLALAPESR